MPFQCIPCGRSFKAQADLNQHIRTSSAHKRSPQAPAQVRVIEPIIAQNPVKPGNLRVPQLKNQELRRTVPQFTAVTSKVQQVELKQAFASSSRPVQATDQSQHQLRANTPNFHPYPGKNSAVAAVKPRWSAIPVSEYTAVLEALSAHCHSLVKLEDNGYITCPYDPLNYINSWKCQRCKCQERHALGSECIFHPKKRNKWNPNRPYKCCKTEGKGCMSLPTHDFQLPMRAAKHKDYIKTPTASIHEPKFRAVTLDCEMAGIVGGAGEVIFLCMTDYVTGAVLLDRFVYPNEKITQMRSSIHGISKSSLDAAFLQGQALSGWEGARKEIWKYIDSNTILVGHALENELDALRMIHPRIVDSGILSRNAVGINRIRWGLKTLCSELLKVEIRENEGGTHDCLEDVLATREVVIFCTRQKEAFQEWARATKIKEIRLEKEREMARQKKKDEEAIKAMIKAESGGGGAGSRHTHFNSDGEYGEILHWSDIAEDLGWPHPDTGYDPWSD